MPTLLCWYTCTKYIPWKSLQVSCFKIIDYQCHFIYLRIVFFKFYTVGGSKVKVTKISMYLDNHSPVRIHISFLKKPCFFLFNSKYTMEEKVRTNSDFKPHKSFNLFKSLSGRILFWHHRKNNSTHQIKIFTLFCYMQSFI